MRFIFGMVALIYSTGLFAQVDISFDIENYSQDSLVIGYYYGNKTLVQDTLIRDTKNIFRLKQEEKIEAGIYLALFIPSNEFIQFIVPQDDQEFHISYNLDDSRNASAKGSEDNETFFGYLDFLRNKQPERQELVDALAADPTNLEIQGKIDAIDEQVAKKQEEIITEHPNSISASLLLSNKRMDIPEFDIADEKEKQLAEYRFYKKHYFDFIDLGLPSNLRTPFLHERVDFYINKLTPQHPDSIAVGVDYLLGKMEPSEETFRYYVSHFLNEYANAKIIGFDAVYVHLVNEYYKKGKTPWTSEENLQKIIKNAEKLDPILMGKQAPDITFYDREGKEINLYDIKAKFTVMLFWAPTCGHCKKSLPSLKEFYAKYKDQGVELLAICTKQRDDVKLCWEMIDDKELNWLNVVDPFNRSNFREVYNANMTPRVFILDENKKIVLKRLPTESLDELMQQLIDDLDKEIIEDETK